VTAIEFIISREREAREMAQQTTFDVEEKTLPPLWVAGVRMRGRYDECGSGFAKIGRAVGRHVCGKPLCLYYDDEYREEDASFEPCMPVRKPLQVEGLDIRELPGGRCVSLLHRGPWQELGRSYERLIRYAKDRGYKLRLPSREVYIKGPGMIFKGNSKNYLTEIQILIEPPGVQPEETM
jgi:effector-binding domain-containing protein